MNKKLVRRFVKVFVQGQILIAKGKFVNMRTPFDKIEKYLSDCVTWMNDYISFCEDGRFYSATYYRVKSLLREMEEEMKCC